MKPLKGRSDFLKQETLSANKGSTLLKRKNGQFTTGRNARWTRARLTPGHHFPTASAPAVTSRPSAGVGRGRRRGPGWVKVKCAETVGRRPRAEGGRRPRQRQRRKKKGKKEKKNQQSVGREKREGFLICFLGRMTKLRGMQQRGEREVIKSSKHEERERESWDGGMTDGQVC